jgi:hypothetical protein
MQATAELDCYAPYVWVIVLGFNINGVGERNCGRGLPRGAPYRHSAFVRTFIRPGKVSCCLTESSTKVIADYLFAERRAF